MPEKYYYPSLSRPLYVNFDYGIIFFFSFETVIIIFHLFTRGRFVRLPPSIERNSIGLTATRLGQGQTHQGGRRGTSGPKRRTAGKGLGKFFLFLFCSPLPLVGSSATIRPAEQGPHAVWTVLLFVQRSRNTHSLSAPPPSCRQQSAGIAPSVCSRLPLDLSPNRRAYAEPGARCANPSRFRSEQPNDFEITHRCVHDERNENERVVKLFGDQQ